MQQREIRFLDKLFMSNKLKEEPEFDSLDKTTIGYRWYNTYKNLEYDERNPFYILIEEVCGRGIGSPQKPWVFSNKDNIPMEEKMKLSSSFSFFVKQEEELVEKITDKDYEGIENEKDYPTEEKKYAELLMLAEVLRRKTYIPSKDKYKLEFYQTLLKTKDVTDTACEVWSVAVQGIYAKGGIELIFNTVRPLLAEYSSVEDALEKVEEKYKTIVDAKVEGWARRGTVKN